MLAGILKSSTNTGSDGELDAAFVAPVSISSNTISSTSDSKSLKRYTSAQVAQRWEIEAGIMEKDVHTAMASMFFAGVTKKMYIRAPQPYRADNDYGSGSLIVEALKGNSLLQMSGTFHPGTFIQFQGHAKVYMVVKKKGDSTTIYPALIADVNPGAIKTGKMVTMPVWLDNSNATLSFRFEDGIRRETGGYKFIEAL